MWLVRSQNNGSHTALFKGDPNGILSSFRHLFACAVSIRWGDPGTHFSSSSSSGASTSEHRQPQWALVVGDVGGRSDHMLLSKQLENPAYILVFSKVYLSGCRIVSHLPTNPYHPLWLLSPHAESSSQKEFQMPFSSITERTSHCTSNCLPNLHTQTYSCCCPKLSSPGNRFQLLQKAFWWSLFATYSFSLSLTFIPEDFQNILFNACGDFPQQNSDGINLYHFTSEFKVPGQITKRWNDQRRL